MSSQENLFAKDKLQQTHVELNKTVSKTESQQREGIPSATNEIDEADRKDQSEKATIESFSNAPELQNSAFTDLASSSAIISVESGVVLRSDATDFIEFRNDITSANEGAMKYVSSFRLEFDDVAGVSAISPTKAWIHNGHKLKLVDIENEEVLRSYYSEVPFESVNGLNENIVFLCFHNAIDRLNIKEDQSNDIVTLLNFSTGTEQSAECRLNAYTVSRSGDFLACVTRRSGCLCFTNDISYIERFDSRANFIRQSKIQHKGKHLIREAYQVIESNNGDICIAGEKFQEKGEFWVVVVDTKFNFRFSYDRNTQTQRHIPAFLAIDPKNNNILIVNRFRDRIKRPKYAIPIKKKKELTYVAIIDENGIFRQHLPTDDFNADGTVVCINADSDGKVWMVLDSGQVIVASIEKLTTGTEQSGEYLQLEPHN